MQQYSPSSLGPLCRFCKDFDYDALTFSGYSHHPSWKEVVKSACAGIMGCPLCRLAVRLALDRFDNESIESWNQAEMNQQVVCSLFNEVMCWGYGTTQRVKLDVCVDYQDPLAKLILGRPVHKSIFEEKCISMMSGWLRKCAEEHEKCQRDDIHRLPTRVLDVGSASESPRLVASRGRYGEWVALSHCWGRHLPIKTEQATLKTHCEGIPITALGPTFKDAVMITRALNIQYIWIDALCIIQDSEADWKAESATMDYVYQNAAFTIAAEASASGKTGIRGSMEDHRRLESNPVKAACHSQKNGLQGQLLFRNKTETQNGRGPLSTRAWTMQEEILSPRILRFSAEQIYWRCSSDKHAREWFPEDARKTIFPEFAECLRDRIQMFPAPEPDYEMLASSEMKKTLISFWYSQVVNRYAPREITFPTDKLVAISGIMKEVKRYLPDSDYEQGLWVEDIHAALVWRAPGAGVTAYREYVAPSWSWAYLDFSTTAKDHLLIYEAMLLLFLKPIAEIIGFETRVVSALDSIERRILTLKGPSHLVCSCRIPGAFLDQRKSSDLDYYYDIGRIGDRHNHFNNSIGLQTLVKKGCDGHQQYLCVQVARWDQKDDFHVPVVVALILEETGSKLDPVYRRVGRALIPTDRSEEMTWPDEVAAII